MIGDLLKRSPKNVQSFSALLIHDDTTTALKISELLIEGGHQVLIASTSAEAFQVIGEMPLPDILIIDLIAPEVEGKTFLETARIRFGKSSLPPVLILADGSLDEEVAHQMNAEDVLPKPFEGDDLLSHLKSMIEARKPKDS